MNNCEVCEHGRLKRKCDSCALTLAETRIAELESRLASAEKVVEAAEAFIESNVADPDITAQMARNYEAYRQALAAHKEAQKTIAPPSKPE